MNSALTINQLLGAGPAAPPLLLLNAAANDSFELSNEELAVRLVVRTSLVAQRRSAPLSAPLEMRRVPRPRERSRYPDPPRP